MSVISSELDAQYELNESESDDFGTNKNPVQTSERSRQTAKQTAKVGESDLSLSAIEQRYDIWRGRSITQQSESLSTGHQSIDDSLHIGGWPRAGLLEILLKQAGHQELSLLMPSIAQHLKPHQRVAFIGLPYLLLPSVLKDFGIEPQQIWCIQTRKIEDQLWAMQQLLKCGHCLMVIAWQFEQNIRNNQLRKLQVAAKSGQSCGVVLRHERCLRQASPASMRIQVRTASHTNASTNAGSKANASQAAHAANSHSVSYPVSYPISHSIKSATNHSKRDKSHALAVLDDISIKILKQPKSFAGQAVSLEHPLKKHLQLIRQKLPVFTSPEKKLRMDDVDQTAKKSHSDLNKAVNNKPLESVKSYSKQLNSQPLCADHSL